jgi:hypothetical protein
MFVPTDTASAHGKRNSLPRRGGSRGYSDSGLRLSLPSDAGEESFGGEMGWAIVPLMGSGALPVYAMAGR